MKALLLGTVVFVACAVIGNATAAGKDPQSPCENGNPTDLCGDTIEVVTEPPGENCPNGGIKITVTSAPEPTPVREDIETTTTTTPEPPEPVETVFFICNGEDGLPGEPGEPGIPGTPGTPGATIIGPGSFPITVTQDTTVNVNVGNGNRRCRSVRERVRLTLPQRMRAEDTVRVKVDRERAISHEVIRDRFVRVNMRGKRCGAHLLQVRKAGINPSLRLWTVTSPTGVNKRVLVP